MFFEAMVIKLCHAGIALAPDGKAATWSRAGTIKVNYDC